MYISIAASVPVRVFRSKLYFLAVLWISFNNSSGSNGTITLSETAANFSYLEIFYRDQLSTPEYASVKVYSPNGRQINLSVPTSNTNVNGFWIKQKTIYINGTTISNQWYCEIDSVNGIVSNSNYVYIIRVDGYR